MNMQNGVCLNLTVFMQIRCRPPPPEEEAPPIATLDLTGAYRRAGKDEIVQKRNQIAPPGIKCEEEEDFLSVRGRGEARALWWKSSG